MKTARDIAHKLSEAIVPACWVEQFDDGNVMHHSRYCDDTTSAIVEHETELGVVFCRCRKFTLANKPDNHFCGTNRFNL